MSRERYRIGSKHARRHNYDSIIGSMGTVWTQEDKRDNLWVMDIYKGEEHLGLWYVHKEDVLPLATTNKGYKMMLEEEY